MEPVAEPPAEVAEPEETRDEGDTDFRRPTRRIRRFPTVWGIDESDYGAACLAAVCRHFGRAVPCQRSGTRRIRRWTAPASAAWPPGPSAWG